MQILNIMREITILEMVRRHDRYRRYCLNLQASENSMIGDARIALSSDLAGRYSHVDDNGNNSYGGSSIIEDILARTEKLTNEVFGSRYCDVRPIGGHIAVISALLSMVKRGDRIMHIGTENGGYPGYEDDLIPSMIGVKSSKIPYSDQDQEIQYDEMERVARKNDVRCIVLGQSAFVRSYDLRRVREMADSIPSSPSIMYDGSHVMGLIAGKSFQRDVLQYSDVLVGSTHKSLYGPQGGIIISNRSHIMDIIRKNITWKSMDNFHPNRVAALGITMEHFRSNGRKYASLVCKNSKELGRSLWDRGIGVRFSPWFSETHQILMDRTYLKSMGMDFMAFSRVMEKNGIITDRDGRIGISEVSRLGMTDMDGIADLIWRAIRGENVKATVRDMVRAGRRGQ